MIPGLVSIALKVFRETFPVVIGASLGELIAGLILSDMSKSLYLLPGLLVLVPAVLDLRGCISSALGSRLGSALHLGLVGGDKGLNPDLKANIKATLILSVLTSSFAGATAFCFNVALGLSTIGAGSLILISLLSGTLAAVTQIAISVSVAFTSFSRGLDPDNVTIPIMATVGDILGITYLFLITSLLGGFLL
jgi:mgtE-like transporter